MTSQDSSSPATDERQQHDIQFPTIRVHPSLADLAASAASTEAQTPTMKKPTQAVPSNLEDSTYEVVDGDYDSENDDGHTASLTSGASVDGRTPDDLLSLDGTEQSHDDNEEPALSEQVLTPPPSETSFEPISRSEAGDEAQPHLVPGDSDSSDDETDDDRRSPLMNSLYSVASSQPLGDERVDDSEMTARPGTPLPEPEMSPSIPQLPSDAVGSRPLPSQKLWFDGLVDSILRLARPYVDYARHFWNRQDSEARAIRIIGSQVVLSLLLALLVASCMPSFSVKHEKIDNSPSTASFAPPPPTVAVEYNTLAKTPKMIADRKDIIIIAQDKDNSLGPVTMSAEELFKEDGFTAQVMGDSHVLITAPKHFRNLKKSAIPEVAIGVMRRATPTQKTQIIYAPVTVHDGVYVVSVDREQAYGMLTVIVTTKTKQRIEQSFQLDFGSPWLKLSRYSAMTNRLTKAAYEELQSASSAVADATAQSSERLAKFGKEALEASRERAAKLYAASDAILNSLDENYRLAYEPHAEAITESVVAVQKGLSTVYQKIRSVTKYVDPAQFLRDAHLNAPPTDVLNRAQHNAMAIFSKLKARKGEHVSKHLRRKERKWDRLMKKAKAIRNSIDQEVEAVIKGSKERCTESKKKTAKCGGRGAWKVK